MSRMRSRRWSWLPTQMFQRIWLLHWFVRTGWSFWRRFKISLDFAEVMWYCVVLTWGATNGKHNKRTVARQYHTARGQQNKLEGNERAPWVYGTAYAFRRNIAKWADIIIVGTKRNNYCKLYRERQKILEKTFTEEQKELFEKFHDCWSEYASLGECAIFCYAFKLGMRIAIETLTK